MSNDNHYDKLKSIRVLVGIITAIITFIILQILGAKALTMDIWINIGISVLSGIISSIGLSIFLYYKYLKKIPEETSKKIDKLLNDRLGYETTNHNSQLQKLDFARKDLSDEHKELLSVSNKIANILIKEKNKNKHRNKLLTSEQKDIKKQVQSIYALEKEMERLREKEIDLSSENAILQDKNKSLEKQIALLRDKENHINKNYEIDV